MTGEHYREAPTASAYDLMLAVRRRPPPALPWSCAAHARQQDGAMLTLCTSVRLYPVPNGQHSDCQGALPQLVPMASNRALFLILVEQSPNIIYRAIKILTGILCQIELRGICNLGLT